MFRKSILVLTLSALVGSLSLEAHCQMPCGIYHDDMVYDKIDQYVETMVKAMSKIKDNKFTTPAEKNELIRWVLTKDNLSDETAQLICSYFLQQKIKPGEKDTVKQLESAQRLLFLIVTIKQSADFKPVSDFAEEWEKFKLMFHIAGYECKLGQQHMEKLRQKQKALEEKAKKEAHALEDHTHADHTHDDHDHTDHTHADQTHEDRARDQTGKGSPSQ